MAADGWRQEAPEVGAVLIVLLLDVLECRIVIQRREGDRFPIHRFILTKSGVRTLQNRGNLLAWGHGFADNKLRNTEQGVTHDYPPKT